MIEMESKSTVFGCLSSIINRRNALSITLAINADLTPATPDVAATQRRSLHLTPRKYDHLHRKRRPPSPIPPCPRPTLKYPRGMGSHCYADDGDGAHLILQPGWC